MSVGLSASSTLWEINFLKKGKEIKSELVSLVQPHIRVRECVRKLFSFPVSKEKSESLDY